MTEYKLGEYKTKLGNDAVITEIGPSVLVGYWVGPLYKRENLAVWDHEGKSLLPESHCDLAPPPKQKKKYWVYRRGGYEYDAFVTYAKPTDAKVTILYEGEYEV